MLLNLPVLPGPAGLAGLCLAPELLQLISIFLKTFEPLFGLFLTHGTCSAGNITQIFIALRSVFLAGCA